MSGARKPLIFFIMAGLLAGPLMGVAFALEDDAAPEVSPAVAQEQAASPTDAEFQTATPTGTEAQVASPTNAEVQDDIVRDEGELAEWCGAHENGGYVTLDDTVVVTQNIYTTGNVVIDTGRHGLVYAGGRIEYSYGGSLEIVGEGVEHPVLEIVSVFTPGGMFWGGLSWNAALSGVCVTAGGKDGAGGVAVRVARDDGYDINLDTMDAVGVIRSHGAGAVGLYLAEPMDAYCLSIEVTGENSAAVYAEYDATLFYCKLGAYGEGASCVAGSGAVTLDACAASPTPQNVRIIERRAVGALGMYQPVEQHARWLVLANWHPALLLDGGGETVARYFALEYDKAVFYAIDTSVPGKTAVPCALSLPLQGLGLTDGFPLELIIDVRDPAIPCINRIDFRSDDAGSYACLGFWQSYDPGAGLMLWRSDDGGASWYDIADAPNVRWDIRNGMASGAYVYYGELDAPMLLQIEVTGRGESNVAAMYPAEGGMSGDIGGDRHGSDRVVTGNPDNTADGKDGSGAGLGNPSGGGTQGGNDATDGGNAPNGDNTLGNGSSSNHDQTPGAGNVPDNGGENTAYVPPAGNSGALGNGNNSADADMNGDASPGVADAPLRGDTGAGTTASGENLILEPQSAFNSPETAAHATATPIVIVDDGTIPAAALANPVSPPAENKGDTKKQASPFVTVTAGVLGTGGMGALTYLLRKRRRLMHG